jgi:hypothetical protein
MEATVTQAPTEQRATCIVNTARLHDGGDITESYSADRIACGQPVRKPFQHHGEAWTCTSIAGSGLTGSGSTEHEAYRIMPERMFSERPTTYPERTDTAEAVEAARNDLNGFYHGITVKHGREMFVLCGPPLRFVAEEVVPGQEAPGPSQLCLF